MRLHKIVMAMALLVAGVSPDWLPAQDTAASIHGQVLDVSGAIVVSAEVVLMDDNGASKRSTKSDTNGEFVFDHLAAGTYVVTVHADALAPFRSNSIEISGSEAFEMPKILLSIAANRTELVVRPTEVIAQEQMKAEEQQRVLGLLPNFYTSYLFDAAPLNAKQKYSLAIRGVVDPARFVGSAIVAGIGQANNLYAGYGQGLAGYGKRYAAAYGDGTFSDILSHAVFPALLHQDPRYFYQGSGTRKSRLYHAISFAVVARNDSGHFMPNYSYLLGDLGGGAISNLYYPHADRGVSPIFINAAIGIGGRAAGSIFREFFSKRLSTNVHGNGKP